MKISNRGLLALILAMVELAFLPILLEIGGSSIGVIQLLFYTFIVGSIASVLLSYKMDRCKGLFKILKSRKTLLIVAAAGVLNYGVAQVLLTVGTLGTNPSVGAIFFRSYVLILALLVPFTLRNRVNKYQLVAICIAIFGMYILVTGGTLFTINAVELPFIIILIGSAFAAAISNLMIKSYHVNTIDSVAVFNIASLIFSAVLAVAFGTTINFAIPLNTLAAILFMGIVTYTLGSTLFYYSFKTLNPVTVTTTTLLIPFLTIPLSFLLLGTPVRFYYIYAYALIAAGMVLQQKFSKRAPEYIKSKRAAAQHLQLFDVTGAFVGNKKSLIYNGIAEGKRALATHIASGTFTKKEHAGLFDRYGCTAFTNKDPHPDVGPEELQFVNEIMEQRPNNDILICLGDSGKIEGALSEFTLSGKNRAEPQPFS